MKWLTDPTLRDFWPVLSAIATLFAAIAALVYVWLTHKLAKATNRSTRITEQIYRAAHRPYVGVVEVAVQPDGRLRFKVANVGSVPANEFRNTYTIRLDGQPYQQPPDISRYATLFPQNSFYNPLTIDPGTMTRVISGQTALEIDVELRYRGADGAEYITRGTWRYSTQDHAMVSVTGEST